MPTIIVASLETHAGRTAVTAGLGVRLAAAGRAVQLARVRSADGADAPAEDDAQALASVPGCTSPGRALSEQDALALAQSATESLLLIEAPAGNPKELAERLSARVVLIAPDVSDLALGDLATTASVLGDTLAGVIAVRQPERSVESVAASIGERGLT